MPYLSRLFLLLACACAVALGRAAHAGEARPNVLLIVTDDQGYGDITSHDNPAIDTPVLDRLASEGARFDRFMVSPMCAPTRASILTGRFPLRVGVHGVTRGQEAIRSDEITLGELFKQAGYATGAFGKWHNGGHYPNHPNGRGFDTFVGFTGGHWENYFDTELQHNGEPFQSSGYITDVLTDHALKFIEYSRERPFFCYVPYNAPHGPFQLPDRYYDKHKDRGLNTKDASVYGMVENIDDNVGRLLAALEAHGVADNTVVIFLTDNGPNSDRFNGNMRGSKGDVHEGGVRVPLFVRWPGRIEAGLEVQELSAHIDLLPTLQVICGLAAVDKPLDGRDLSGLLGLRERGAWPDRTLFNYAWGRSAVRTERWRAVKDGHRAWELYDMQADPGQRSDVVADHPEVIRELRGAYERYGREVGFDEMTTEPVVVGHAAAPRVLLPAHEAVLHTGSSGDGIRYVTENGWAGEWITRWTDAEAYPEWRIDVKQPGPYHVTLRYAARKKQVGGELSIQAGDASVGVTIDRPFELKRIPARDRVREDKTYIKDWGRLDGGVISLEAGVQALRVRVLSKPANEVLRLKAVELEKIDGGASE